MDIRRNKSEELYKSYFGDNYKFTYDEGFSLLISNHTGWVVRKYSNF